MNAQPDSLDHAPLLGPSGADALHLVDAWAGQVSPAALVLLSATRQLGDAVWLLGGRTLREMARDAGLEASCTINVPGGDPLRGAARIARHARRGGHAYDRICCWSPGALAAARILWPRAQASLMLTQRPHAAALRRLRRLARWRRLAGVSVACLGRPMSEYWHSTGITAGRVRTLDPTHVRAQLEQAPMLHSPGPSRDGQAPGDSGEHDAGSPTPEEPGPITGLLLADPPADADVLTAMVALGAAWETLPEPRPASGLRLIVHPDHPQREAAARMLRHFHRPLALTVEPRADRPWQILPHCDFSLTFGPAAGGLSTACALAAPCPLVAADTPAVRQWVEPRDRPDIYWSPRSATRDLAAALRRVIESQLTHEHHASTR